MVVIAEVGVEAAAICGPVVRGSNVPAAATEDASGTRTQIRASILIRDSVFSSGPSTDKAEK